VIIEEDAKVAMNIDVNCENVLFVHRLDFL